MRNTLRALAVIALLVANAAQAGEPNAKRTPPFTSAIGVVTAIIHSANAYRAECTQWLSAKELDGTVGQWFKRNQSIIDQVNEKGKDGNWQSQGRSSEQIWDEMWQANAAQVRMRAAEAVKPAPKAMCVDALRPFSDGSLELANFPVHLQSLDVKLP